MELLKKFSVPTPNFHVVSTVDEAIKASQTFSKGLGSLNISSKVPEFLS